MLFRSFLAKGAEGNGAQSGGEAGGIVTDSGKLTVNGEKALVLKEAIPGFGFTLVSSISIFDLKRDIRATAQVIFIQDAAGIVLALYLTVILSKRISKPVQELTIAAEKLQNGDFSVRCPAVSEDEVGVLARSFNVMAYKVDCLLKEVETEQRRKREYELALIQAQVKPHFLYNTLDLIYVFCQSGMSKEGARMTKYLAISFLLSSHPDSSGLLLLLQAITDRIFHQRLHGQSRYLFRHALLIYRVFHEKTVRETDFLYRHEIPHILDLFSDRHEGGRLHGIAHHHGKCLCHIHNLIIIPNQRQHGDALQRIIDKMRVNLDRKSVV